MSDIFDTKFEGKALELDDGKAELGDDINLSVKDPTLRRITVGMGWDLNAFNADVLDLDVSVFLLNKEEMTRMDSDFIFYNNDEGSDGAIVHGGDSRTGAGDGDDESLTIDLQGISYDVMRIIIVLSVYKGNEKEQNLGMVRNAYVRVMNTENLHEFVRYEIDDVIEDKTETAMIVGQINREGPKWHFKPQAEFFPDGLAEIATKYGCIIGQQ